MKGTEYEFRLQAQNEENYGVAAVDHVRTEDGGELPVTKSLVYILVTMTSGSPEHPAI